MYGYVGGRPINNIDRDGLKGLLGAGTRFFGGLLAGCTAIAYYEGLNSPYGPNISHCIVGCSLSRCSKGLFGDDTAFVLNHLHEVIERLLSGSINEEDSINDDAAAMDGANFCGDNCNTKTCYECCQSRGFKDNEDIRRTQINKMVGYGM